VSSASTQGSSEGGSPQRPRPRIYTLERTGVLIISLLILIITLLRYWENINWSAR
jgi:hypothetical protein